MLYNLHFFSLKCRLFHNATLFDFCITHILNTECAKIKKKIHRLKVNRSWTEPFNKTSSYELTLYISLNVIICVQRMLSTVNYHENYCIPVCDLALSGTEVPTLRRNRILIFS